MYDSMIRSSFWQNCAKLSARKEYFFDDNTKLDIDRYMHGLWKLKGARDTESPSFVPYDYGLEAAYRFEVLE